MIGWVCFFWVNIQVIKQYTGDPVTLEFPTKSQIYNDTELDRGRVSPSHCRTVA